MFIGEMGCWLVILARHLYTRFLSPSVPFLHGGYSHLNTHDSDADSDASDPEDTGRVAVSKILTDSEGRKSLVGWRVILLALPACCDITGTTLMNVGLLFVAASIYQMTRGALILFVGLFSVIFLKRKVHLYQWFAMFIVVLGVMLVGLAGAIAKRPQALPEPASTLQASILAVRALATEVTATAKSSEALYTILGVLMIAAAQIFTATQFVLEEWILEHYSLSPIKVVAWEGLFGFAVTLAAMLVLHFAVGATDRGRNGYFDAAEGWREITTNRTIAVTSVLIMISIGGFNFFGLSITRSVSATARSIIDTCRTLFIWIVSLGLGWETFKWLQIGGFVLLVYGTFLFNDIVRPPLRRCGGRKRGERLLVEEPVEHL